MGNVYIDMLNMSQCTSLSIIVRIVVCIVVRNRLEKLGPPVL